MLAIAPIFMNTDEMKTYKSNSQMKKTKLGGVLAILFEDLDTIGFQKRKGLTAIKNMIVLDANDEL